MSALTQRGVKVELGGADHPDRGGGADLARQPFETRADVLGGHRPDDLLAVVVQPLTNVIATAPNSMIARAWSVGGTTRCRPSGSRRRWCTYRLTGRRRPW